MNHVALSPTEVGELLSLHPTSVRAGVARGDIPGLRVGRVFRIPARWVREQLEVSQDELVALLSGGEAP